MAYKPLKVKLDKLEITNFDGSITIDLTHVKAELNVYEDLMQMTMYGNVVLYDALDMVWEMPIIGEEEINLTFAFFEEPPRKKFRAKFRTYKIANITRDPNDRAQSYIIHFTSPEQYKQMEKSVTNAYTKMRVSDMAKKVYNDYIKISDKKVFDVENTKTPQNFVAPSYNAFATMDMLIHRAWSARNKTSNYVFYEDRDGFHFRTVESFLDKKAVQEYYFRQTNIHTINKDNQKAHVDEAFVISNLTIVQVRDNLKHLIDHMHNHSIMTYDMIAKDYQIDKKEYLKDFGKYKHLEKNPLTTGNKKFFNEDGIYMTTDVPASQRGYVQSHGGVIPKFYEEYMIDRQASFAELDTIVVEATIPGDHERKPGDIVEFKMPSATVLKDLQEKHRYLSGRYLVTRVRHKINLDDYITIMQLVKESYPKKIKAQ